MKRSPKCDFFSGTYKCFTSDVTDIECQNFSQFRTNNERKFHNFLKTPFHGSAHVTRGMGDLSPLM